MLHYIHIQGKSAPAFYFRNRTAQHFKSLIQSLTEKSSLVISSLYRTDILYIAEEDFSESIFKIWALQEQEFDPKKLMCVNRRESSLELYFTSLVSLSSATKWYEAYLDEFRYACSIDRNNPILKDLKLCEQFLQESNQTIARPLSGARPNDLLPRKEVFGDLVKHINDFLN